MKKEAMFDEPRHQIQKTRGVPAPITDAGRAGVVGAARFKVERAIDSPDSPPIIVLKQEDAGNGSTTDTVAAPALAPDIPPIATIDDEVPASPLEADAGWQY